MREEILERQKQLGIVPPDAELAPWADGVPHWDELDDAAKRVAVRLMETYAGFAEHADQQIGRLVDTLDELEVLDNTLFVYMLGDNGASGEGGIEGTIREHLVGHGIADDVADMDARIDEIGGPDDLRHVPGGLGARHEHAVPVDQAGRLALRRHPRRPGRALAGAASRPAARSATSSTTSSTCCPTILDAAGLPLPETVEGVTQQRMEGTSMRYSFDDADAPERRRTQYFEMVGNRGIYHEGWTAVTRHREDPLDAGRLSFEAHFLAAGW